MVTGCSHQEQTPPFESNSDSLPTKSAGSAYAPGQPVLPTRAFCQLPGSCEKCKEVLKVGCEHGLRSVERSAHAMSPGVFGFIRRVAARHRKVERTRDRNLRV